MPKRNEPSTRLSLAFEATHNLWRQGFIEFRQQADVSAHVTHSEIERLQVGQMQGRFYGCFFPLMGNLTALYVVAYRRYFKLAYANPQECSPDPNEWACNQIPVCIGPAFEWIEDWFTLACDGENRYVRRIASVPFVPGDTVSVPIPVPVSPSQSHSWCAPCWTFLISPVTGISFLKEKNVPDTSSDQRLGRAHTRLLFKAMRRVFLGKLKMEIETARNEETAAGAVATASADGQAEKRSRQPNNRKGWQKREKAYTAIRAILTKEPSLKGMKFCAALDTRHAQPLQDWTDSGEWRQGLTWKEAWRESGLKRKIRRVRQEAMKKSVPTT
ncbi:MAG TPA: hypothetical protein VMF66_11605 [Candidatus Acidoferrum sp.]|nr:hypothetical protein [Candidatus Acidoferrum sp.]